MVARTTSGTPPGTGRRPVHARGVTRGMASAPLACLVSGLTADDGEDDAALALVARLRAHLAPLGGTVATMTPLARDGQPRPGGGWHSPRVARLTAAASFVVPQHAACPFVLPAGAPREGLGAPAVAASAAGPGLRAQPVREAFQVLATWADVVVVAGIGGWLTPPVVAGAPATGPLLARMCQRLHLPLLICTRLDADAPERAQRAMALAGVRPVAWLAVPGGVVPGGAVPQAEVDARLARLAAIFQAPCVGQVPAGGGQAAAAAPGIALEALLPRLASQITQDAAPCAGQ